MESLLMERAYTYHIKYMSDFQNFQKKFGFGWGALPPRPPEFWLGGQSPPRPPPKRLFVTFDRGGQTGPPRSNEFFFGAVDDAGAIDGTGAADNRPTTRSKVYLRRLQNAVI